jgi:copper homeostasis protein CutC
MMDLTHMQPDIRLAANVHCVGVVCGAPVATREV